MQIRNTILLLLMTLCFPLVVSAQQDDVIRVRANVDKAFVTIGDKITYSVVVEHSPSVVVRTPINSTNLSEFEVRKVNKTKPFEKDGLIIEQQEFVLTTFELGEYVIEGQQILYATPDGKEHEIKANAIYVTVESVGGEDKAEDIRDIKGVFSIKSTIVRYIVILLGMIILAIAAIYIIRWWRYRRQEEEHIEIKLSPHDEAYAALEALKGSALIAQGKLKEYYTSLSDIIRHYIARRYDILTMDRTTFELVLLLRSKNIGINAEHSISMFLQDCDIVKFAKYRPTPDEIKKAFVDARLIIDTTKVEEPPEELTADMSDKQTVEE